MGKERETDICHAANDEPQLNVFDLLFVSVDNLPKTTSHSDFISMVIDVKDVPKRLLPCLACYTPNNHTHTHCFSARRHAT